MPLTLLLTLLLIAGLIFTFRANLFRSVVTYQMVSVRTGYKGFLRPPRQLRLDKLSSKYKDSNKYKDDPVVPLIKQALAFTTKKLTYAATNTRNQPGALLKHKRAHCVGYAAFFKASLQSLLKQAKKKNVTVYHVVGKLSLVGINLHQFSNNPFFKDHDYNIVVNQKTTQTYFIDPSLHDLTGITFIQGSSKDSWPNKRLFISGGFQIQKRRLKQ